MNKYAQPRDSAATVERMERDAERADQEYDRHVQEEIDMGASVKPEGSIFDVAATMARMQAEAYRQVRTQARREALEDALIAVQVEPNVYAAAAAIRALKDKS